MTTAMYAAYKRLRSGNISCMNHDACWGGGGRRKKVFHIIKKVQICIFKLFKTLKQHNCGTIPVLLTKYNNKYNAWYSIHLSIDFKKAYDSVRREAYYIPIEYSIPRKLVRIIKMCLTETYSRVQVGKNLSDRFPIGMV
jgi:hypothetical protein